MDNLNTMQSRQPARPTAPMTPIKGSWEEKLIRGQQLIAVQNDDGAAILAELIERLADLPKTQRLAANRRLEQILVAAINDLIPYLTYREQYDRAVGYTLVAERLAPSHERLVWQFHRSAILITAEQFDECFKLTQTIAHGDAIRQWCFFTLEATRHSRIDIAERVCTELEQATNRTRATQVTPGELRLLNSAYGYAKAVTAMAQANLPDAKAWMQFSLANDDLQDHHDLARFYTHLIEQGHLAEALDWIHHDLDHPSRAHFWRGFVEHRLDRHTEARKHWKQAAAVAQLRSDDSERIDGTELILALYYLGDKDGAGLGIVLNTMNGEGAIAPAQFYLAGLGWAIREDNRAAHSNFQLAYIRSKSLAMGKALPTIWWRFCQDLIPEATLPDYAHYFLQESTANAPAAHTGGMI